jgi:hypothetical protein
METARSRPPTTTPDTRLSFQESSYAPRPVASLGIWEHGGWRLKTYSIAYERERARSELVSAAKEAAKSVLPMPAVSANRYGVGFLGVHDGRGGNLVFVDWWEGENDLHHSVFLSPSDEPTSLRAAAAHDLVACVFDLGVIAYEREAWIRDVLSADQPDLDVYLDDQLSGAV